MVSGGLRRYTCNQAWQNLSVFVYFKKRQKTIFLIYILTNKKMNPRPDASLASNATYFQLLTFGLFMFMATPLKLK